MKQQRMRFRILTFVVIGLLGVAAAYGVYSVSMYGSRWFSSARNTRYRSAKRTVIQGDIVDRNGVILASTDEEGQRTYQSNIRSRSSVVHLVGDADGNVANGVDSFQASYLLGFETSLTERVNALIKGETRRGDNVMLTVDSKLCTEIAGTFATGAKTRGLNGAAVVINYKTGEVIALVSLPVFDPLKVDDSVRNSPSHPFWNRATQSTLAPGSTFKIITAASSIQNLPDALTRIYECTGAMQVMEHVIHDYGKAQHNSLTLEKAFRVSCNNTFAQIALTLGDDKLRKTAEGFGFNQNFLFRDLVVENSTYPTTDRNLLEIAWSGAGQSKVVATPLHMCMIAAAIANDGVMMEPRLVAKVESPTNVLRQKFSQKVYTTACTPELAATLQSYMKSVVSSGTGSAAQVSGLTIAGKTGSAEASVDGKAVTHAWFVGYIEDEAYPYAVSVMVEAGDSGGGVAAPVAKAIFSYLKQNAKK